MKTIEVQRGQKNTEKGIRKHFFSQVPTIITISWFAMLERRHIKTSSFLPAKWFCIHLTKEKLNRNRGYTQLTQNELKDAILKKKRG
jgi:hypothetical protein